MAKRARKPRNPLDKAAIKIGRALGKAISRIKGVDAESRKAMEVRGRTLQQLGRDAGRRIAYLGESGPTPKRRSGKSKASRARAGASATRGRRTATRKASRRRTKKAG
jgi:hypothetical protein